MSSWHLYPDRKVVGRDFSKEQNTVVPNQSMSLKEILRRFVRRESLPVEKQGIYAEGFGDLEKIQYEDLTQQEERIEDLKEKVRKSKKRMKDEEDKKAKELSDKAAAQGEPEPKADKAGKTAPPKAGTESAGKSAGDD